MSRIVRPGAKTQLWSPETGIRFAPSCWTSSQPSSGSLYPTLDMARFFHAESHGSGGGLRSSKVGSDDPEVEAVKLRPKSTRSSRVSPAKAQADIASKHVSATMGFPKSLKEALARSFARIRAQKKQSKKNVGVKPPCTSLSFNIRPEAFYEARSAKAGSKESFWKYTMYEGKSAAGTIEQVRLHYCTTNESMEAVCKKYFLGENVIGFDLEWLARATREDGARDNVSLIQIASPDHIALFHLAVFPPTDELLSPTLRKILEDATVSKVGVHIRADCTRMANHLGVTVKGIFELSHLYKQIKYTEARTPEQINKKIVALATQVEEILGLPLFKEQMVRSSDWTKILNQRQLLYSASDAYAGVQLYHVLEEKRKSLDPCPERPYHVELDLPIPSAQPASQASTGA
ncbi:hypothetical protein E4U17_006406 [Claviceps sp. LM77 group G4]|nr:hypothetical protein E4U17_006406 [Claviceps sp. LM77 group G4]KAG6058408.1 hypothetical protein E4U33_007251 [Claviceps sp. LM78 group G4]KAG6072200.1 hypothetical protein E4U16_005565 [Claviceps sp. LM84 group G4]